jgi:hypothetical protein
LVSGGSKETGVIHPSVLFSDVVEVAKPVNGCKWLAATTTINCQNHFGVNTM